MIRLTFSLLVILSPGTPWAWAEEPKLIPFASGGKSTPVTRQMTLDGVMAKWPGAVKLFEFHDEFRTLVLLKLTDSSYASLLWGEASRADFVFKAEDLRLIPRNKAGVIQGDFEHSGFSSDGQPFVGKYHWEIDNEELDLGDANHLLFSFQFVGVKGGPPKKKVTIAVDWKAGRVEGVKTAPVTGKETSLEP
jgi:hypothetical protein